MTRANYQVYEGYVRNYICPDPEWHARKHATASHAFDFFEHGLGHLPLADLTVGTVTQFRVTSARPPCRSPPHAKSSPCCR
jgi:hypothetical protein